MKTNLNNIKRKKWNLNNKNEIDNNLNWKDIFVYNNWNWVYELKDKFFVSYIDFIENPWIEYEKDEPKETALVIYNKKNPLDTIHFILYWDLREDVAKCNHDIWEILELFLKNKNYKMSKYSDSKKEFNDFLKNNTSLLIRDEK